MSTPKIALCVIWALSLLCVLVGGDGLLVRLGAFTFWLLVVVHALETAFFFSKLKAAPGSLGENVAKTFFFGFLHLSELPDPDDSQEA